MNKSANIVLILTAMMLLAVNSLAATLDEAVAEYKYAITLISSLQPIKATPLTQTGLRNYQLYVAKQIVDDKPRYYLKLGFFKTEAEAQAVYKIVNYDYLEVSIVGTHTQDIPLIRKWLEKQQPALVEKSIPEENQNLPYKELMLLANQAMQENNFTLAIGIYTKVIESSPNPYQQDALENLGLAREKNNQLAHAITEYRRYLKTYPTGEGAIRVKQRVDNLLAQHMSGALTSTATTTTPPATEWIHYGQWYQFYYKDTTEIDSMNINIEESLITTSFNYTGRTLGTQGPMKADLAFTHIHDTNDSDNDRERLTSLYFDMTTDNRLLDMRIGRQKNKTTSAFNRYDGIDLGYLMSPNYKARFTTGFPVDFYETVDDRTDKYFYAIGLEFLPDRKTWNTSIFYLEQQADSLLDRQELVIDTKYLAGNASLFTSIDYSLQYETLNLFLATFNQRYADNSTLNLMADYRKTPFLTTTNALQGQIGVSSLADLLGTLTENEIEQLSLDRTSTYESVSAYYSKFIATNLQITADAIVSNMSGTVASGGVEALLDTGNEYSYSLGLISQHLFMPNDHNYINLRFSELTMSDTLILNLSSVLHLDQSWRINPKLRYDSRDYSEGRHATAIRPAISIKNKINKYWQLELDLAYEDKETDITNDTTQETTNTLLYAGYLLTF